MPPFMQVPTPTSRLGKNMLISPYRPYRSMVLNLTMPKVLGDAGANPDRVAM